MSLTLLAESVAAPIEEGLVTRQVHEEPGIRIHKQSAPWGSVHIVTTHDNSPIAFWSGGKLHAVKGIQTGTPIWNQAETAWGNYRKAKNEAFGDGKGGRFDHLDHYLDSIRGRPYTHDGVSGHIHTEFKWYHTPGNPKPTGIGSWTVSHIADAEGKKTKTYQDQKAKLGDDFHTEFEPDKVPFFPDAWAAAEAHATRKLESKTEIRAAIASRIVIESGERTHAVVSWHDGRPVAMTADMSHDEAQRHAKYFSNGDVIPADKAAVIRKHMASGHSEKYVNKVPPAEEAAHPAIAAYNAARQREAEAKLKTPEGEAARQARNLAVAARMRAKPKVREAREGDVQFADPETKRPVIGRLVEKRTLADKSVLTIVEHPDTKAHVRLVAADILS